jgi:hypothetical protein
MMEEKTGDKADVKRRQGRGEDWRQGKGKAGRRRGRKKKLKSPRRRKSQTETDISRRRDLRLF